MPVLSNPKWERFCQERIQGKSEIEAYELSGFSPDDGNASRLSSRPEVQARIQELTGNAAERAEVTVASLIEEAEAARLLAMGSNQASAAVAAIREKGVLSGKRIERAEHGGPGDFNKMSSDELADYIKARANRVGASLPGMGITAGSNGSGTKPH